VIATDNVAMRRAEVARRKNGMNVSWCIAELHREKQRTLKPCSPDLRSLAALIFAVLHRLGRAADELGYLSLALLWILESDLMPDPTIVGEHSLAVRAVVGLKSCQ
jgi:hypothetical protein